MYSNTSMSLFSVWMTSWRETMFSCLSSFINEISRIAVEGVPSSESRCISLSATSSPVCRFRPLKTWRISRGIASRFEGCYCRICAFTKLRMLAESCSGVAELAFSSCWNELGCRLSISSSVAGRRNCGFGLWAKRIELGETSCSAILSGERGTSIVGARDQRERSARNRLLIEDLEFSRSDYWHIFIASLYFQGEHLQEYFHSELYSFVFLQLVSDVGLP